MGGVGMTNDFSLRENKASNVRCHLYTEQCAQEWGACIDDMNTSQKKAINGY